MTWQEPKTDWKAGDVPTSDDFNRIEGNSKELGNKTFPHIDDNTIHVTPNSNITGSTPPNSIPNGIFLTHASSASTFEGTGRAGNVITSSTNGYVIQIFVGNDNKIMTRRGSGSTWGAWQKGGEVESVNGKKGDVILTAEDVGAVQDPTHISIYVSTTGSDYSGDGSWSKPFKTIQKAVDVATKLPNTNITIDIAPGTYDEDVSISRITKPYLQFYAPSGATIKTVAVERFFGNIHFDNITISLMLDFDIVSNVVVQYCNLNGPMGVRLHNVSRAYVRNCKFTNDWESVIAGNSSVYCVNNTGTAGRQAFLASGGAMIFVNSNNSITGASGLYETKETGQIFTTSKVHS